MTDWFELLGQAAREVTLRAPASAEAIQEAETRLGHPLPEQLVGLLEQTDGFYDEVAQYEPCWSLSRLVEENVRGRREAVMPQADHKLCFGDNGAGEPFFVLARTTDGWAEDVLVWSWIDEEARTLAPSLDSFWQGWSTEPSRADQLVPAVPMRVDDGADNAIQAACIAG